MPSRSTKHRAWFTRLAKRTSRAAGHPAAFCVALGTILVWGLSGPLFGFSDTWQLVINTSTTIVTFLMVFLIQNTQNRDSEAIQVKLDELIRSIEGAHLGLLDLEELEEKDLDRIREELRSSPSKRAKICARENPIQTCGRSARSAAKRSVPRAARASRATRDDGPTSSI